MLRIVMPIGYWLKVITLWVIFLSLSLQAITQNSKGVGINNTGENPDPSAMLDVKADSAGVLIPRTDTSAVVDPADGLLIYDVVDSCFYYFRSDKWVKLLDAARMRYSYADRDGDGYGDAYSVLYAPDILLGYTYDNTDCDDNNAQVYPGAAEACDGFDNDCDPFTPDGSAEPALGSPCDGPDADLCEEGLWECVDGVLICSDNTDDNIELCDGIDNDCDPSTPDGSGEPLLGSPCDGPDTDLCEEGTWTCSGGSLICSDATSSELDVCDGVDNDCDPSSPDGSEDPVIGTPCDGPDADLCEEGVWQCISGVLTCSDNTDDNLDICDGLDNDCDPSTPDGSQDPMIGSPCDGPDADLCEEGVWQCVGGVMTCTDNTGDSQEVCDGVDNDCDGQTDEGDLCGPFEVCLSGSCVSCCSNNGGNTCSQAFDLGAVCGDQGADVINISGCGEAWYEFELSECDIESDFDLQVTITLSSPPGMDYDLYLYALNCSDVIDSSVSSGSTDQVGVVIDDEWPPDQSTSYRIWVRLWSGEDCSNWQLNIEGN